MGKVNAISSTCTGNGLLYEVDLTTGSIIDHLATNQNLPPFSITQHATLFPGLGSTCNWEGVLKITMPAANNGIQNHAVKFVFTHDTAQNALGFPSFHIGDSMSNAADGSDAAEVVNDGTTLNVYTNQQPGHPSPPPFATESNFITERVDVDISDRLVIVDNFVGVKKVYENDYLFPLDGSGTNYDILVGLNRKIVDSQPSSSGKGLCHVKIYDATCP